MEIRVQFLDIGGGLGSFNLGPCVFIYEDSSAINLYTSIEYINCFHLCILAPFPLE